MAVRLLVMGGGKMGEALVAGLLDARWASPEQVVMAEVSAGRRLELASAEGLAGRHLGLRVVAAPTADLAPVAGAVIAVKPHDVRQACHALAGLQVERLLSVAAGVRLEQLEAWSPEGCAVVRAMPNTAAMVREGAAAIVPGARAGQADLDWAREILSSVGSVAQVTEPLLDAVTGLSGAGPAYVFVLAEAMTEAGVAVGLARPLAYDLVLQTLAGSARLLRETGQSPESLRAAVTSPAGATAAGLRALEARAFRSAVIEAVAAATQRSREMGASPPEDA